MSDLLTAARQALPGLEWEEDVDGAVHTVAYDSTVCMHRSTPDKVHAWIGIHETRMATPDEAAQWLRAQVESRRAALDAALGDSQWARVAELEKAVAWWVGMRGVAAARADAAEAKLKAVVASWPPHYHRQGCPWGMCNCGADKANAARAEARRLLEVSNG